MARKSSNSPPRATRTGRASNARDGAPTTPVPPPKKAAARKPRSRPAPPSAAPRPAVRVRMYRQGIGDCFLLTFPHAERGEFHVLIDCGLIVGTPGASAIMARVADDVARTTGGVIDVVVATHEHWDHLSGFHPDAGLFRDVSFGEVWLAWTEDPDDADAARIRRDRQSRLEALQIGFAGLKARFRAAGGAGESPLVERSAQVLSFFGIDPDTELESPGDLAAAARAGGRTAAALKRLREDAKKLKYCRPGDQLDLPAGGGVRVYVLAPPIDLELLRRGDPTRAGDETYLGTTGPFPAAPLPLAQGGGDTDVSQPFDSRFRIDATVARDVEFFRDHYFGGSDGGNRDDWRRIGDAWTATATDFAMRLDEDTNNTSLVLAFELPDGRVLLFPGDAQVGNWQSWHRDEEGRPRTWTVDQRVVTTESLLARTVLYKVAHHGSRNATLRAGGLEAMTDPRLTAMVPVDAYVAHDKKHWAAMPFPPLMARLDELTHRRVIRADVPVGPEPRRAAADGFLGPVTDAAETIEVIDEQGRPTTRPLYVDYVVL